MMKKLLFLIIVLSLATSTKAVLTFTVNGEPQPDEITLRQGEAVSLGIELLTGNLLRVEADYLLSNPQAEFIWNGFVDDYGNEFGPIQFPTVFDFPLSLHISEPQHVRLGVHEDPFMLGYEGGAIQSPGIQSPVLLPPATIMTDLVLHCLEPTDVVLDIYAVGTTVIDGEQIEPGTLLHTLTIHQVPEPITLSLLAFGSIFVLRRRKK